MQFGDLVGQVLDENGLSFDEFVAGLNDYLPADEHYSSMAARHWAANRWMPYETRLEYIRVRAPEASWQRGFATAAIPLRHAIRTNKGNGKVAVRV